MLCVLDDMIRLLPGKRSKTTTIILFAHLCLCTLSNVCHNDTPLLADCRRLFRIFFNDLLYDFDDWTGFGLSKLLWCVVSMFFVLVDVTIDFVGDSQTFLARQTPIAIISLLYSKLINVFIDVLIRFDCRIDFALLCCGSGSK
jgi:hypothetical protein